ncbi:MAG: FAD-dependent oxidoreductase [Aestuariivita sp.]|uniref:FAD-dependent oxidoreductase n=1 Tax=Aestuariivita sp. TaxID=1872407 RepID=UPI003BAEEA5F
MAQVLPAPDRFELSLEVVIVGAGAAGLIAALTAHEAGREVLVLERDVEPAGSTALSAGLIPAAGTMLQKAAGIEDSAALFEQDIQAKAKGENDPALVNLMAGNAAGVIDWLAGTHGLPFSLVDDFDYPGHSQRRMHGLPTRAGRELIDALRSRCEALGIDIVCEALVDTLYRDGNRIAGIGLTRPDGQREQMGCKALILACNGYGGNRDLVRTYMPEIDSAVWFGHDGNKGDAVLWGQSLGARTRHLGAYQGHGNVAHPHGILITWAVITEGGFQVNTSGARFWDESQGYSEAARAVLSQPDGVAFAVFDARIAGIARQFADFRAAEAQGAVISAQTPQELAIRLGLPEDSLSRELDLIQPGVRDRFGRRFPAQPLSAPFCAVKVTGALFHTQGGLVVDSAGRVCGKDGATFENLYAAGGAACGVSGAGDAGYLSGNGLLSAAVLGRIAGLNASG